MQPRLLEKYKTETIPAMMKEYSFTNALEVPRLKKIVLNVGMGDGAQDKSLLEQVQVEMAAIVGQRPVITKAKKDIANFKLRKGSPVGCKVTLRGVIMYEFLDRLISIAIPRVRDFRGLPSDSFDEAGNYSMGLTEQTIFPEVDADKIKRIYGMNIVIVTSAKGKEEARSLLKLLGMPFAKKGQ